MNRIQGQYLTDDTLPRLFLNESNLLTYCQFDFEVRKVDIFYVSIQSLHFDRKIRFRHLIICGLVQLKGDYPAPLAEIFVANEPAEQK